ncbi:hypothetical protein GCM10011509_15320 [Ornithinimicrobium pekingense]|uniref:Glycine zipper family protein n=2 Tax=Ornithinimicrobium pekingense TaxID=384677 RepID=A0ABQ2F7C4_9MICO|nr:hypothetical protein GCM10011509_15320 [Ornithinimicrobium pekingense]
MDGNNRFALGIAFGLMLGTALSLILDNWALLGVGFALGITYGIVSGSLGGQADEPEDGSPRT